MKKNIVILLLLSTVIVIIAENSYRNTPVISQSVVFNDSKSERLYNEAVTDALVQKIEGTVSGLDFRMYTPKEYYASSTKEVRWYAYKDLGEIDVVKIYRRNQELSGPVFEVFAVPYNKDKLITSEKARHTFSLGEPGYGQSKYEHMYSGDTNERDLVVSKIESWGEGGNSSESYYAYIYPKPGVHDHVLVVSVTVDNSLIFDGKPAIMQKDINTFFKIISEMAVW